jgi:hypothetical protein
VSQPIPLHPDADLAVVLDDLRQSVAAWGDEGLVMRFFRASISLMLLSILDTLIELLADFRAGRLPPVLPADEPLAPSPSATTDDSSTTPPQCGTTSAKAPAARRNRALRPETPCDAAANAPEPTAVRAPRRRFFSRSPTETPIRRSEPAPRGVAGYPSVVPRSPWPDHEARSPLKRLPVLLQFRNE